MRFASVLPLLLVLGCAHPASLVSVCEDMEPVRDDRLLGEWSIPIDGARDVSVVISPKPGSIYAVYFRSPDRTVAFDGRLANIAGQTFLELQRPAGDDPAERLSTIRPYVLVRYIADAEGVRLVGCRSGAYLAALREHGLPTTKVDALTVYTGAADELREFLALNVAELFPSETHGIRLRRIE